MQHAAHPEICDGRLSKHSALDRPPKRCCMKGSKQHETLHSYVYVLHAVPMGPKALVCSALGDDPSCCLLPG